MTVLWTAADAAKATHGSAPGDWAATGVSIDSRAVETGDLFVAIKGPRVDGHDYVAEALSRGGAAAMVHRPIPEADAARLLTVPDTYDGLIALAGAAVDRAPAKRIAVTGSVGKTGVKEMLALVLGAQGPAHATLGNLNNQWGLPLTLARMPADTAFGVFELGMSAAGELTPLSRLARPHVAIVTAIELAHAEFFASAAEIAKAKAEVFAGLEPGGVAVINRDTPHFAALAATAEAHGAEVVGFGHHDRAGARLTSLETGPRGSDIVAEIAGRTVSYRLGVAGRHWAVNSLAVLAAVAAVGADVEAAAATLATMSPPKGRGQRHRIAIQGGEIVVVDESYNASPASVGAALETLAMIGADAPGRRIAVLGDMLELGETAPALHAGLAEAAIESDIDAVYTCGPLMEHLAQALPPALHAGHAPDAQALATMVVEAVRPGDVIMVKGSAGSRTGAVVEALKALNDNNNDNNKGER